MMLRVDLVLQIDTSIYSTMETELVDNSQIAVNLTDYYFVGDGKSFDKHFFILKVTAENFKFTVDRSYVDFVELDRQLRKKFPESSINRLPLDETRSVIRSLQKEGAHFAERKRATLGSGLLTSTRTSLVYNRESMMGMSPIDISIIFSIPEESREDISGKRYALDKYLQDLLSKHEIVGSDEIVRFLDEEKRSMVESDEPEEPLSVHDLLLINVAVNKVVVHRSEEFQYHVPRGHLILWRFSTQYYDIGFSVEMNGAVKVPYTRCASHKAAVCGTLEVTDPSICVLKWDNSYAKLRTKQLSWSVRVVSPEAYQQAKSQALDVQRERKRFENQRFAVQRSAGRLAAVLSGVVLHETSVLPDHAQEETLHIKVMESELRRLKNEVNTLLNDLKQTETLTEELTDRCRAAEETKEHIAGSWAFSASQLDLAEAEIQDCNVIIEELSGEIADRDDELEQLDKLVVDLERNNLLAEKNRREVYSECSKELRSAERDAIRREKKLRERQAELGDIKSAILQATRNGMSNGSHVTDIDSPDTELTVTSGGVKGSNGSSKGNSAQQAQFREEKLCLLVEKLLADLEKSHHEVEHKNGVLKVIAEQIAAASAAANPTVTEST